MTIEQNNTHIADALANRIEQLKNKPDFAALLISYVTQIQDLEDALFEVLLDTTLDTSVGQQLDNIGEIVGELRLSRDDETYRTGLRVRILINKSSGTIEELLEIAVLFAPTSSLIELKEFPTASFVMEISDILVADPLQVVTALDQAKSAGVNFQLQYALSAETAIFTLASGNTIETSSLLGAANDGQTTGGHLSGIIEAGE